MGSALGWPGSAGGGGLLGHSCRRRLQVMSSYFLFLFHFEEAVKSYPQNNFELHISLPIIV